MRISHVILIASAAASFSFGFFEAPHRNGRLDSAVRNNFFRGFQGDAAALRLGLKACEDVLAANPNHAEALVWHGAGTYFQAGQAFRAGDRSSGMQLAGKALAEMEQAVALEPGNLAVRIPRGAALVTATRAMPPERARPLREKALTDYEVALARQEKTFAALSEHARGELLSGLAELHLETGQPSKAAPYLDRMRRELAGTPYATRAAEWAASGQPRNVRCIGCHIE